MLSEEAITVFAVSIRAGALLNGENLAGRAASRLRSLSWCRRHGSAGFACLRFRLSGDNMA